MARSGIIAWLALILVVVAGALAPSASAAQPNIERINVDETFVDEELSEACDFEVTFHAQSDITVRTFSGERTGPAQLVTLHGTVTATGPTGNSVTVRDVGGDLERVEPDGTLVLLIFGQVPFAFTGALKIDLETGEAILEPQHIVDVDEVCARLTA
jgi:hypothetical protein